MYHVFIQLRNLTVNKYAVTRDLHARWIHSSQIRCCYYYTFLTVFEVIQENWYYIQYKS